MNNLLRRYFPAIAAFLESTNSEEYKKKHTYKVRFSNHFTFRDKDIHDRQLQTFFVHGEPIMAYSKKDAIKRWVHKDLKHRRKKRA